MIKRTWVLDEEGGSRKRKEMIADAVLREAVKRRERLERLERLEKGKEVRLFCS